MNKKIFLFLSQQGFSFTLRKCGIIDNEDDFVFESCGVG